MFAENSCGREEVAKFIGTFVTNKAKDFMNQVSEEISRSMQINQQLAEMRNRHGYPRNPKNDPLMAYFDIISEHHAAIGLLIKEELIGSSFVLVRPIMETLLRAAWANACATAQQQAQLLEDDDFRFPPINALAEQIDAAYATERRCRGAIRSRLFLFA